MGQIRNEQQADMTEPHAEGTAIDYRHLAEELVAQHGNREFLRDVRAMDRDVAGEQYVLKFLSDHDGMSHPTDVRRGMGVTSSRVAAILRCLERRGFVERAVDPADRRCAIVTLTDAGRTCMVERRAAAVERCAWLLERLGPEDARTFICLQRRIRDILRESGGVSRRTGEPAITAPSTSTSGASAPSDRAAGPFSSGPTTEGRL